MTHATEAQVRMLHVLRQQHRMDEETYRHMLYEASEGRTTSTKLLTQLEAFKIIDGLVRNDATAIKADKMRKKIIAMAREMAWTVPVVATTGPTGRGFTTHKVDMERINTWCLKYSYAKKKLNAYSAKELPKLVTQFENGPYKDYLKKV